MAFTVVANASTGFSINLDSVAVQGQVKVWNGSAWVVKPVKVWNGSAWIEKPLKRWNGSAWVETSY